MPMLPPTARCSPSYSTTSASTVSSRLATVSASRGDRAQDRVAGVVAQRVVDVLEVVKVDEQHRGGTSVALRLLDRGRHLRVQHPPVGDTGQRVAGRLVCADPGLLLHLGVETGVLQAGR